MIASEGGVARWVIRNAQIRLLTSVSERRSHPALCAAQWPGGLRNARDRAQGPPQTVPACKLSGVCWRLGHEAGASRPGLF